MPVPLGLPIQCHTCKLLGIQPLHAPRFDACPAEILVGPETEPAIGSNFYPSGSEQMQYFPAPLLESSRPVYLDYC